MKKVEPVVEVKAPVKVVSEVTIAPATTVKVARHIVKKKGRAEVSR